MVNVDDSLDVVCDNDSKWNHLPLVPITFRLACSSLLSAVRFEDDFDLAKQEVFCRVEDFWEEPTYKQCVESGPFPLEKFLQIAFPNFPPRSQAVHH